MGLKTQSSTSQRLQLFPCLPAAGQDIPAYRIFQLCWDRGKRGNDCPHKWMETISALSPFLLALEFIPKVLEVRAWGFLPACRGLCLKER